MSKLKSFWGTLSRVNELEGFDAAENFKPVVAACERPLETVFAVFKRAVYDALCQPLGCAGLFAEGARFSAGAAWKTLNVF
jgi:hypothetical protein